MSSRFGICALGTRKNSGTLAAPLAKLPALVRLAAESFERPSRSRTRTLCATSIAGRPLRAGRIETAAYLAMLGAALARVGLPLLDAGWLLPAVGVSSALWTLAFVLYLIRYTPLLLRPRADGQPG